MRDERTDGISRPREMNKSARKFRSWSHGPARERESRCLSRNVGRDKEAVGRARARARARTSASEDYRRAVNSPRKRAASTGCPVHADSDAEPNHPVGGAYRGIPARNHRCTTTTGVAIMKSKLQIMTGHKLRSLSLRALRPIVALLIPVCPACGCSFARARAHGL